MDMVASTSFQAIWRTQLFKLLSHMDNPASSHK